MRDFSAACLPTRERKKRSVPHTEMQEPNREWKRTPQTPELKAVRAPAIGTIISAQTYHVLKKDENVTVRSWIKNLTELYKMQIAECDIAGYCIPFGDLGLSVLLTSAHALYNFLD